MAASSRPEAIVLTGTIIPHGVETPCADPTLRRAEYLRAIQFYRQWAPVYFLENSAYSLAEDPDFAEAEGFHVRKFPLSANPERGKGYQEFEMIDAWLVQEAQPPRRWVKVTGRYVIRNMAALLEECARDGDTGVIIDQIALHSAARTFLFAVQTEYYRAHLQGLYRQCDDRSPRHIVEHVVFEALQSDPQKSFRLFANEPDLVAVAGSSGRDMQNSPARRLVKQTLRAANRLFDKRRIWYIR